MLDISAEMLIEGAQSWVMQSVAHLFPVYDADHAPGYTPSQRGNYHHSMFHNPTAAVNLFHVGKQYLTLCKAEAAVTRKLDWQENHFQRQTRWCT